jgi:ABC-type glycerol-3-phosphate transport system substrate-binding protein
VAGGWIPASQQVVDQPEFQEYLQAEPAFATFVRLASSANQHPTPAVPGAQFFQDAIIRAAEDAMFRGVPAKEALTQANNRVRAVIEAERSKTSTAEKLP